MRYFPVFLDLDGKTVLVAGGGSVAANKLRLFAKTAARLRCVARDFDKEILELAASGRVEVEPAEPAEAPFGDALIVVAATESEADETIARRAQEAGRLVNAVDKTSLCTFIMPSIVDRGSVAVAIGTEGGAPVLARRLRERVEILLPDNLGALADFIGEHRGLVSEAMPSISDRRRFWEEVIDGHIGRMALSNRPEEAREALKRALAEKTRASTVAGAPSVTIIVSPAEPEDLTIKALRALQDADLILLGERVPDSVIDRARRDAERVSALESETAFAGAVLRLSNAGLAKGSASRKRIVCLLNPGTDWDLALGLAKRMSAAGYGADVCAAVRL